MIACEVVPTLVSIATIMSPFYGCICPTATMVVHDLILPITHGSQGASNGIMIHSLALLQPAIKAKTGYVDVG